MFYIIGKCKVWLFFVLIFPVSCSGAEVQNAGSENILWSEAGEHSVELDKLLGTWVVGDYVHRPGIFALTDEDAKELMGTEIILGKEEAYEGLFELELSSPVYKYERVVKQPHRFIREALNVGPEQDFILHSIRLKGEEWLPICFSFMYSEDQEKLISEKDGVWFIATKKQDDERDTTGEFFDGKEPAAEQAEIKEEVFKQNESMEPMTKQDHNEELVKYVYSDNMNIYIEQEAYSFIFQNPALKQTLTKWMNYTTIHRASRTNYTKIYELTSKRYLKERFPEVNNAQELEELVSKYNEIYFYYFLAIEKLKKINSNRIEIVFTAWYSYEGVTYKTTRGAYFLKINGTWKYDGAPEEYYYSEEKLDIHFNP